MNTCENRGTTGLLLRRHDCNLPLPLTATSLVTRIPVSHGSPDLELPRNTIRCNAYLLLYHVCTSTQTTNWWRGLCLQPRRAVSGKLSDFLRDLWSGLSPVDNISTSIGWQPHLLKKQSRQNHPRYRVVLRPRKH